MQPMVDPHLGPCMSGLSSEILSHVSRRLGFEVEDGWKSRVGRGGAVVRGLALLADVKLRLTVARSLVR